MSKRKRLALSLVLLVISTSSLFIFSSRRELAPDKSKAFPRGIIVVGVDASVPPFASDDGRAVYGLDIDLADAIARYVELPTRFVNIGFYSLYDALASGEVDILISALRIEDARMDDVRYTRHYFDNGLLLVTSIEKPIAALEALTGQRVAYEIGSQADTELRKLEESNEPVTRLPYELPIYALDSLRLAYADAAIVDAITLRLYQRQYADWRSTQRFLTRDYYAIAARRDNQDAWRLVDGALAALKENGELDRIIVKWL